MVLRKYFLHVFMFIILQLTNVVVSEWWRNEVIYQIYPRSFMDSNGDGIGDLNGIRMKLDYFVNLGVKVLWLSPIYKSPMVDFGYDISDFVDIDPLFGDLKDFDTLVSEMHIKGLYLVMDFVPNHSSDLHPWFQASRRRQAPYSDFYVWRECKDGAFPNNWLSNFGGSAWSYDEMRGECYLHQFDKTQPDLNYKNAGVRQEMEDVVRFWVARGVDGLRVDAIKYLVEDDLFRNEPVSGLTEDTNSYTYLNHIYTTNSPDLFPILYRWRTVLQEFVNTTTGRQTSKFMATEAYDSVENLEQYYSYDGNVLADYPFNFLLIEASIQQKNRQVCNAKCFHNAIKTWLDSVPAKRLPNWVLGNHDNQRLASRFNPKLVNALNVLLLTLPGVPTVYYGDELGMQDIFLAPGQMLDPLAMRNPEQCRDGARSPMQWSAGHFAGFTTSQSTWLPVHNNYKHINVETQMKVANSTLNIFKQILHLRKHETDFENRQFEMVYVDASIFVYKLYFPKQLDTWFIIVMSIGNTTENGQQIVDLNMNCDKLKTILSYPDNITHLSLTKVVVEEGHFVVYKGYKCQFKQQPFVQKMFVSDKEL